MKKFINILITTSFALSIFLISAQHSNAEDEFKTQLEKATVLEVIEEKDIEVEGLDQRQVYQKLKVRVDSGDQKGKEITVDIGGNLQANTIKYKENDKVVLSITDGSDGSSFYYITNYQRTNSLMTLAVLFVLIVIIIGGIKGFRSLIGLAITLLAIFTFIIPSILKGSNPILISVISSIFLVPITFYLSHGVKKSTNIAIIGTLISVLITGILASIFITNTNITGTGIEDSFFLQTTSDIPINLPNLLIAGIIISSLGVLDDVTISQVSIVETISKNRNIKKPLEIYKESIEFGKNHIASMVNTLVLTYTGSSISLLLLFSISEVETWQMLNLEVVSLEVVRTFVSSISLMLAIPITTIIATYTKFKSSRKPRLFPTLPEK